MTLRELWGVNRTGFGRGLQNRETVTISGFSQSVLLGAEVNIFKITILLPI